MQPWEYLYQEAYLTFRLERQLQAPGSSWGDPGAEARLDPSLDPLDPSLDPSHHPHQRARMNRLTPSLTVLWEPYPVTARWYQRSWALDLVRHWPEVAIPSPSSQDLQLPSLQVLPPEVRLPGVHQGAVLQVGHQGAGLLVGLQGPQGQHP